MRISHGKLCALINCEEIFEKYLNKDITLKSYGILNAFISMTKNCSKKKFDIILLSLRL